VRLRVGDGKEMSCCLSRGREWRRLRRELELTFASRRLALDAEIGAMLYSLGYGRREERFTQINFLEKILPSFSK